MFSETITNNGWQDCGAEFILWTTAGKNQTQISVYVTVNVNVVKQVRCIDQECQVCKSVNVPTNLKATVTHAAASTPHWRMCKLKSAIEIDSVQSMGINRVLTL